MLNLPSEYMSDFGSGSKCCACKAELTSKKKKVIYLITINSNARLIHFTKGCVFPLHFFLRNCLISVRIKINPIKTPIEGTVGISSIIAMRCPAMQFNIPKETAMARKGLSSLVKRFANDAGITSKPITMIAPTLSKLKTVETLDKLSRR